VEIMQLQLTKFYEFFIMFWNARPDLNYLSRETKQVHLSQKSMVLLQNYEENTNYFNSVGSAIHLFFLATYKEYIYVAIQLR
jgi:hypothetical protein